MPRIVKTSQGTQYLPDPDGALRFKGVPIGSFLNEFTEKLLSCGYVEQTGERGKNSVVYIGTFASFSRCRIEIEYTPLSKVVYVVRVDVDDETNDDVTHVDRYKLIKKLIRKKYKNHKYREKIGTESPRNIRTTFEFDMNQSITLKVKEDSFYIRYMDETYTPVCEDEEEMLIMEDL